MKIIFRGRILERMLIEHPTKMSYFLSDWPVSVYHGGNRTRDKRNPAAMLCREMNKATETKYLHV